MKYLIHLKDGDTVKINGLPCRVFGEADVGTNTNPEAFGVKYPFDYVPPEEELKITVEDEIYSLTEKLKTCVSDPSIDSEAAIKGHIEDFVTWLDAVIAARNHGTKA